MPLLTVLGSKGTLYNVHVSIHFTQLYKITHNLLDKILKDPFHKINELIHIHVYI